MGETAISGDAAGVIVMNSDARRPLSPDVTMPDTLVCVGDGKSARQERRAALEARAQYVALRRAGQARYMALPC